MKTFLFLLLSFNLVAAEDLQEKLVERKEESKAPAEVKEVFKKATMALKESGIEKRALKVGLKAPKFELDGKSFKSFYSKKPVILKFYRGHWCPYCMIELKEYQKNLPEISKHGQLIGLVPDKVLEIKKTKLKHGLGFPIYRDAGHEIAKKFGIAFKVDSKVLELYNKFGIDLNQSQGSKEGELPLPGTYVIDTKGNIVYSFLDADYTSRAKISEVLAALKKAN